MANSAPPWVMPSEFVVTIGGQPSSPDANTDIFKVGQQVVHSPGNPVCLIAGSRTVKPGTKVTVIAKPGNTGLIYFANSSGECVAGYYFDALTPGLAHSFAVNNVNEIYIDAEIADDGVSWYCEP